MANYEIWKIKSGISGTDAAVAWLGMMPVLPMAGIKPREGEGGGHRCWYIEGNGIKMMYDCGQANSNVSNFQFTGGRTSPRSGLANYSGGGADELRFVLEDQLGVSVDEVNYVVPSHLHSGWSWNVDLFPNAQLLVNRQELVAVWAPEPAHRFATNRELLLKVLVRKEPDQLLIIDGDYNIAPGLDVIFTAGHSHGHNCLLVQTAKGKAGMLGEMGISYAHIYPGDPHIYERATGKPLPFGFAKGTYLPMGLLDDAVGEVKGMERMRALADILVSHDDASPKMIPEQWWDKPSEEYQNYVREAYKGFKAGVYPDVLRLLERRKKAKTAKKRRQ